VPDLVISDTSPLFYLHRLRCLDLLQKLYQWITVPQAVADELKEGGNQSEDVPNIREYE
jgi:predicted nucleic acid-binding protein